MSLATKKIVTKILSKFASVEELATGARLFRISNLRVLTLTEFQGANSTLAVPEADKPESGKGPLAPIFRTDSSGRSTTTGYMTVNSTNGYVQRYYAGTYNGSASGASNVSATDKVDGVAVWIIGGGTP